MKARTTIKAFLLVLLFSSSTLWAKTFRVAGLYPTTKHKFQCTCGLEAACVTKAAVERARREGMNVSLDIIDKKWTAVTTAEAALDAVDGHYDAVVGTLVSTDAIVAARIFEKAQIPFVVPLPTNPQVTEGKHFVTRIPFSDRRQAKLLAKLIAKEFRVKHLTIIKNTSVAYSNFLGDEVARDLHALRPKLPIKTLEIIDGYSDYRELAEEALEGSPEIIFVPLQHGEIASLYAELAERKARLTLLGSDVIEGSVVFNQTAGRIYDGIRFIYVNHWNGRMEGPQAQRFAELYRTSCAEYTPSMAGVGAYDAIMLMLETLKKHPTAKKELLIRRLKNSNYVGMAGPMKYGPDGEPLKPLQLFEIKGRDTFFWRRFD